MKIAEGLETGIRYFWKRTGSWKWLDGRERWWEVDIKFDGFNGAGGVWLTEYWHWNGSAEILRVQPRTLDYETSKQIIDTVKKARAA